ncbi:hypothetical protein Daus18300_004555 [Diaporthe australafricana]|uniref:RNase H type-1 domain-containing protein n=1 Tax=Diaporthe australafricana TaxID=127596 RepID=A0ABR3X7I5_9PEZI
MHTSKACSIPYTRRDNNDVTEAFALAEGTHVAIDQIMSLLSRDLIRSTDKFQIYFWSDSKVVLRALEDPRRYLEHSQKMQHILHMIELKTRNLQSLRASVSVQFRWLGTYLSVFPPREIESLLRRQLSAPLRIPSSPSAEGATSDEEPAPSGPEVPMVEGDAGSENGNLHSIQSPLAASPGSVPPGVPDPAGVDIAGPILHHAPTSSEFFTIIATVARIIPYPHRHTIRKAVRRQKKANEGLRALDLVFPQSQGQGNGPADAIRPDPFSVIELAATKLPAPHNEVMLAAVNLQKETARNEALGIDYESESSEDSDVDTE